MRREVAHEFGEWTAADLSAARQAAETAARKAPASERDDLVSDTMTALIARRREVVESPAALARIIAEGKIANLRAKESRRREATSRFAPSAPFASGRRVQRKLSKAQARRLVNAFAWLTHLVEHWLATGALMRELPECVAVLKWHIEFELAGQGLVDVSPEFDQRVTGYAIRLARLEAVAGGGGEPAASDDACLPVPGRRRRAPVAPEHDDSAYRSIEVREQAARAVVSFALKYSGIEGTVVNRAGAAARRDRARWVERA